MDLSHMMNYNKTIISGIGFDWNGVNFLHSSSYGARFWICAENSADNTEVF